MISKRKISTLTRRAFCCENKLAYHPWKNILSRIYFFFYEITLRNVPRSPSTFFPPKRILNRLKKISIHAMNRKQWLILFKERIYKIKIITKLVDCPFLFFFFLSSPPSFSFSYEKVHECSKNNPDTKLYLNSSPTIHYWKDEAKGWRLKRSWGNLTKGRHENRARSFFLSGQLPK